MKKVLILYTLPPDTAPAGRETFEFDCEEAARGVAEVLPDAPVLGIRGEAREVLDALAAHRPDVVFNLCEAPRGRADLEPHIASLLEWMAIPFTGCGSEALSLCRRKDRTRAVLAAAGVAVPREGVFPCIVKPAEEDGSAWITRDSICDNAAAVERARALVPSVVTVEEFLPGREFAVTLWGKKSGDHTAIGETLFRHGLRLNTYAAKWEPESAEFAASPLAYDSEIAPLLRESLLAAARGAWCAVGARGYLRVDVRLDAAGTPRVIDVNPNAALGIGIGVYRSVVESGWRWRDFVEKQIAWAC